ncbi:MAG TPA: ABC transporter permease [Trueperaceae bacterium]|nr:ABC transporter permease [Trueperaceae bacterium]
MSTAATTVEARPRSGSKVVARLKRSPHFLVGAVLALIVVVAALAAPLLSPADPYYQDYAAVLQPPGTPGHLLGTDAFGRDQLSRMLYGARISLAVGISSVALGLLVGVVFGMLAGYYRRLDRPIMMINDILIAFPGILLAISIVAALGTSLLNVIVAVAIFSIPTFARITRGAVLGVREADFVASAHALGSADPRILLRTILPNILSPVIVYASLRLATSILTAATLSFLGLGAQPPSPEWGAMINQARTYLYSAPYLSVEPGVAIFITVLAFNLLGDSLRDALDPRSR